MQGLERDFSATQSFSLGSEPPEAPKLRSRHSKDDQGKDDALNLQCNICAGTHHFNLQQGGKGEKTVVRPGPHEHHRVII